MSSPQRAPRSRSAFAAAFLSLVFPGLGHAYSGAFARALGFAALPILAIALLGGIALRADRVELFGFVIQQPVLIAIFILNIVALVYRIAAAVDAWQVARFLNAVDASGGGRLGRARLPLNPLSVAGLLAVVLVIGGGHAVVARYDTLALGFVDCVFGGDGNAECDTPVETASPGTSGYPIESEPASEEPTSSGEAPPTPEGTAGTGTPAPTLPPWDGKERLNVLLIGSDQRPGDSSFNTDTMIVVSVDPASGKVAMFQVPRDMVDVPVPANARSVWGSVYRGKINSWYTQNRNRSDMWPGKNAQARGMSALKAILGELYGLDIRYYGVVNFDGFVKVVDTLGGVLVNVQIPVAESNYPDGSGRASRIYIPAGPQHMTGTQALAFARSRHRSTDFDRGFRQQRVLVSLREQMSAQAIIANLSDLIDALKTSIKTDIKTSELPKLLALAEGVDTKNIRSYVFTPNYYATEFLSSPRGYIITPNVTRIRKAVKEAFTANAALVTRREKLGQEAARVWVLDGSGRTGLAPLAVDYLNYNGMTSSSPNQKADQLAKTRIVVYNGAEDHLADTIAYLEDLYATKATLVIDPKVTAVDIVVTLGRNAPILEAPTVG